MTGAGVRPVRCLLSDCDGVVVDSEVIAEAAVVDVLAPVFPRHDVRALTREWVGVRVADIIRRIEALAALPLSDTERDALCHRIDSLVAERAGPIDDVVAVYAALGLPIAVVSNSAFPRLRRSVERAGLLPWVGRHLYSAEDVGRPKPAPDAYLHAARQLGVDPADCVVVEDSPTGVRAAVAAGMRTLGFTGGSHIVGPGHGDKLVAEGAGRLFDRMSALPALLAAIASGR